MLALQLCDFRKLQSKQAMLEASNPRCSLRSMAPRCCCREREVKHHVDNAPVFVTRVSHTSKRQTVPHKRLCRPPRSSPTTMRGRINAHAHTYTQGRIKRAICWLAHPSIFFHVAPTGVRPVGAVLSCTCPCSYCGNRTLMHLMCLAYMSRLYVSQ